MQQVRPLAAVEGIAACWVSIDLQGLVDSHMASIQSDAIVFVGQGKPTPYQQAIVSEYDQQYSNSL